MKKEKRIWDDVLTERDRKVYGLTGFGEEMELGHKPALLIIDVTYKFVGDKSEPILESTKRFPLSCGEVGWTAVKNIQVLLDAARKKGLPILFAAPEVRPGTPHIGATKRHRAKKDFTPEMGEIVREIASRDDEIVIHKETPSVFFGTPLMSYLTLHSVDTLVVCGTSTSGCVRASVVDAFSHGLKVAVVEECTFDRGEVSHKVNLFDMHQKYADVISLEEALEYIENV